MSDPAPALFIALVAACVSHGVDAQAWRRLTLLPTPLSSIPVGHAATVECFGTTPIIPLDLVGATLPTGHPP